MWFLICTFFGLPHKIRSDVLSARAIEDLKAIFAKLCGDFGAELKQCSGEDDHVHLLLTVSKLVSLKGVSSRLSRDYRPEITARYKDGVLCHLISPAHAAAPRCPS
jgi:putative transposase